MPFVNLDNNKQLVDDKQISDQNVQDSQQTQQDAVKNENLNATNKKTVYPTLADAPFIQQKSTTQSVEKKNIEEKISDNVTQVSEISVNKQEPVTKEMKPQTFDDKIKKSSSMSSQKPKLKTQTSLDKFKKATNVVDSKSAGKVADENLTEQKDKPMPDSNISKEINTKRDGKSLMTQDFSKIKTGDEGEKIIQGPEFESDLKTASSTLDKPKTAVKLDQEDLDKNLEANVISSTSADIEDYIKFAIEKNASDIHFTANYPVFLRVDGKLQKVGTSPLNNEIITQLLESVAPKAKWQRLIKENIEADFMLEHKSGNRFRINLFKERGNLAGAFRLLPKKVRTIEELNLPSILKEFSKIPYGLVLVTGPTGSGKSTTIAAMIEEINRNESRHIITIEDPVEYIYEPALSLISQRNMYEDTNDWSDALRAVLREDPDVVVIGEMRDYETIASALTIAETGHLVFATLHTNNAAQTIDRIIDVFPQGQQNQVRSQLSSMLSGVISQRLVPLLKGGRRAAVEILIGTTAVKNAIRENKTHQINNIMQTSADLGMITMEKSLVDLIRSGLIDIETAKEFTSRPDEIDLLLK